MLNVWKVHQGYVSMDVLIDRIELEYLFYCFNLVVNGCFLISNPHEYLILFKRDYTAKVTKFNTFLWHGKNSCHNCMKR